MTSLTARPGARAQVRGRASGANNIEKQIMGVPARIMRPCLLLVAAAVGLTLFGLVMIYSASSVEAMSEQGDAAFYVKRQALFIVAGLVLAAGAAKADYHKLCSKTGLAAMGLVIIGMLVVVRVAGSGANGATRWLEVGPLRLQPSEFAKVFVLLAASGTAAEFFAERTIDQTTFAKRLALYVGLPVLLIVVQPDKGTAGIICLLVFVIAYDAGFDRDILIKFALLVAVVGLVYSLRDDYSRQRVLTMFNPWSDEWGNGYQLTRGFMAFGSGGLTGVGLGMSRMKYSYLPEAHNDFVFAIVGEELGPRGHAGRFSRRSRFWPSRPLGRGPQRIGPRGAAHRRWRRDASARAAVPQRVRRARAVPALRQAPAVHLVRRLVDHELPAHRGRHRERLAALDASRDGP